MNIYKNRRKVKMVLNGKTMYCYLNVVPKEEPDIPQVENEFITSNGYKFMTSDNKIFLVKEA